MIGRPHHGLGPDCATTAAKSRQMVVRQLLAATRGLLSYASMGVLDEAIREHLELKRRHGATDAEIAKDAAEALGPARREPPSAEEEQLATSGVDAPTQFLPGSGIETTQATGESADQAPASATSAPPYDVASYLQRPTAPPPPHPDEGLSEPHPSSVPPPPPPHGAGGPGPRPMAPPSGEPEAGRREPDPATIAPPPEASEDTGKTPPEDGPDDFGAHGPAASYTLPDDAADPDLDHEDLSQRPLEVFDDEPPQAPHPQPHLSVDTEPMDLPDLWLGEQVPPGERSPLDDGGNEDVEESEWHGSAEHLHEEHESPPHEARGDQPDELDFDH